MSRFYEDAMEDRQHAYVGSALAVPVEVLNQHPYQLSENASEDGLVYGWRVLWDNTAPPGVQVDGATGSLWTDINQAPDGGNG